MPIEDAIAERITELIVEGHLLREGDENSQVVSDQNAEECRGWLVSAANIVQIVVPDQNSIYRKSSEKIANADHGYTINQAVGEVRAILINLKRDIQSGLISVADNVRAEVFDDFLDHAKAYMREGRKNEAGVIAGVVFEDSLRRVCRKLNITETGKELDTLISKLASLNILSAAKAKRARVSAHIRTKATHAQWGEFDEDDVRATIEFTDEFIKAQVEK